MDFFFSSPLDTCDHKCDPGMACLDDDERNKFRDSFFWKQDGMGAKPMGAKPRGTSIPRGKSKPKNDSLVTKASRESKSTIGKKDSYTTKDTREDNTVTSYYPSRHAVEDNTVTSYFPSRNQDGTDAKSETEITCPTTATECDSNDSEYSEWTQGTEYATYYGEEDDSLWFHGNYERIDEPEIKNVWSSADDSVGAVKATRRRTVPVKEETSVYNSAFDYIRNASRKFSNPMNDPPSDKSLASSRSIRAEDAGSVLLRKGIIKAKNNELARQILRRRRQDSRQAGTEP